MTLLILKPEVDVNTYYYYCRCCCCRWWHWLLGLLVLRPSVSSLLQSTTAFFITKCDGLLLQSATAFSLQSATSVITKCDRYHKVWQFYYKVRQVLQSATIITKCNSTHQHRLRDVTCKPAIVLFGSPVLIYSDFLSINTIVTVQR